MTYCHYCRTAVADTVDHVVPKARGGGNAAWNLAPACSVCNRAKADHLWPEHCRTCRSAVSRWERGYLGLPHISDRQAYKAPRRNRRSWAWRDRPVEDTLDA